MAVFTDIENRVASPPFNPAACARRLAESRSVAQAMYLVHVSGRERPIELTVEFTPHEIPTSADIGYCSDLTRRAEDLLGLPRSAYFYAGRANPSFGDVAMAFAPACEAAHSGTVTPFDTGGLVHPKKYIRFRSVSADEDDERVRYGRSSEIPLASWRAVFARVLAAYFETSGDYWDGRPSAHDPEGLYGLNTGWRAWTFEVRFSEGQSVHARAAWCATKEVMVTLRRRLNAQGVTPPGDPPSPLDRFLADPVELDTVGTPDFCGRLEQWVREQVLP